MVRVGVFERRCADGMSVCKLTFGAEPKDCEVYAVWLAHWNGLAFSPLVEMERYPRRAARNPKRMQRTAQEKERRFYLHRQKKKEKHRGR